jgi:hypothetical protein
MSWSSGLTLAAVSSLFTTIAAAAAGVELRGTLYALGSSHAERLYTWEMRVCPNVWTSRYYRLDGTIAVEDETRFVGTRFMEHSYVRHTIGERSSVKVNGQQIEFKYQRGNEAKSEKITANGVFLTGPAVFPFIQQHLRELRAGKEFEFKYGVLDRLDYFTFKLSNVGEPGGETSRVRIRATSVFVRMAIDPIYVTLSKDGRFKGIAGRSIIMEQTGNEFRPVDADLVVESEIPTNCDPKISR